MSHLFDVITFGATFDEHLQRLDLILQRIKQTKLKLKPSKCEMFQPEVSLLGHSIQGWSSSKPQLNL